MPAVKRRFRGKDPHPPCPDCRGTAQAPDGEICPTCDGMGELGWREPTTRERKEGMRADTLALLIKAEDIALLGNRVAEALDEENSYNELTGERDEAATREAIRRRCEDAGYTDDATG